MRCWMFAINDDADEEIATGLLRAPDADAALALVAHPETTVWPLPDDSCFPPGATGMIYWQTRGPSLMN